MILRNRSRFGQRRSFFLCARLELFYSQPAMATPTLGLDDTLKQLRQQQDELLQKLAELQKPERKDMWDKLGALTGLLVALVGGIFSFLYSYHQSNVDHMTEAHQEKIQEVQTVGTFMPYLVGTDDNARSVALAEVQSILGSKAAILIVDEMNATKKAAGNSSPDTVALRFLQRVADNQKASDEDKDLAKKVLARVRGEASAP
ncbi:MAG TPA: hypothetical protein VJA94_20225 [Candidatus Angelobacter sp.]